MGQPGAASVIWHGQNKCFSPALSEAVGQPTLPAGVTYTARQNEPKILKAIPPRLVAFLRKTEGSHSGLAFCGTPVQNSRSAGLLNSAIHLPLRPGGDG